MKKSLLVLVCCFLAINLYASQNRPLPKTDANSSTQAKASTDAKPSQPATPAGPDDLRNVLAQANKAAQTFKTAKAKFQWDQYEKVVDETDVQKGEVYFRRSKTGMDAAVRVTSPDIKQVVFVGGTLKLFQPKIKQVTIYDARAKRTEVESLMNIGFGSLSFSSSLPGPWATTGVRARANATIDVQTSTFLFTMLTVSYPCRTRRPTARS